MGNQYHPFVVIATSCVAAMPFVGGRNGANDLSPSDITQCSGSSCLLSGVSTTSNTPTNLCPAALDHIATYIDGSSSDEYIKVKFDMSKNTYQI